MTESRNLDLSIIIISNRPTILLINCIKSIYKYTSNVDYELILVVNGVIAPFINNEFDELSKEKELKVLKIENNGYGDACNKGMEIARGTYFAILNDDIQIQDNVFYDLVFQFRNDSKIGIIGPKLVNQDGSLQKSYSRLPSLKSNIFREIFSTEFDNSQAFKKFLLFISKIFNLNLGRLSEVPKNITSVECLMGAFFLVRKDIYKRTGGFDHINFFMHLEEGDWFKRIQDLGFSIIYYPSNKVIHYGSSTTNEYSYVYLIQQYKSYYTYYKLHSGSAILFAYILTMVIVNSIKIFKLFILNVHHKLKKDEFNKGKEMYSSIIKVLINPNFRSLNVMKYKGYKYIKSLD